MSTPQDELRAAALKIAAAARVATPGPWTSLSDGDRIVHFHADGEHFDYVVDEPMSMAADAAWIALASPALAEPLAAWLDDVAACFEQEPHSEPWTSGEAHALELARALNGSQP